MNIFYKIGSVIPYYKDRYLLNRVDKVKYELLGKPSTLSVIWKLIKPYWLVVFGILLFAILLMFFNFKGDGNIDFLKGTFAIPLSIVGIIIPIIILIITILDKKSSSTLVKSYLRILNPFMVFLVSIFFLAINVIIFFFYSMKYSFVNDIPNLLVCAELTSIFTPLIGATFLVLRIINLIDDHILYDLMEQQMSKEIKISLNTEIETRITRFILGEECNKLNLGFEPWSLGKRGFIPINAKITGKIKDINLKNLEEFGNLVKKIQNNENINFDIIIVKCSGSIISMDNEALAYTNLNEKYMSNLELELNKSFIINKGAKV